MASKEIAFLTHSGDTELYHFGVKGMKWGQRKGSYGSYPMAKKRIDSTSSKLRNAASKSGSALAKAEAKHPYASDQAKNLAKVILRDRAIKYVGNALAAAAPSDTTKETIRAAQYLASKANLFNGSANAIKYENSRVGR